MEHYTSTQKKKARIVAIQKERGTLKTSMLQYRAGRGKALTEMQVAEGRLPKPEAPASEPEK
jgi:hypothetical protein